MYIEICDFYNDCIVNAKFFLKIMLDISEVLFIFMTK